MSTDLFFIYVILASCTIMGGFFISNKYLYKYFKQLNLCIMKRGKYLILNILILIGIIVLLIQTFT